MQRAKRRSSSNAKVVKAKITNKSLASKHLWNALVDDDLEQFKEILGNLLEGKDKDRFAYEAGLSRRTLFRMLSPRGNPKLSNLTKLLQHIFA